MNCRVNGVLCVAVLFSLLLAAPSANGQMTDAYNEFNTFSAKYFTAENEELTYATFGQELMIAEHSIWVYSSQNSAAIGFSTSLPADAHVEYGLTDEFGMQTGKAERRFYTHTRYLTDLQPGQKYHYRLVATDERGDVIRSDTRTFTTGLPADVRVIRIPDDMQGPPYVLDQAGAYYLVTSDLTVEGTAFEIPEKTNITLDLGGRTVTYNNKAWPDLPTENFPDWIRDAKYGLKGMKATGLKIYNGKIVQGAGNNRAQANSIGYNPIYLNNTNRVEIAGVTIQYGGAQQIGIYNHWGGNESVFRHNVFRDIGADVRNRHGAGSRPMLIGADRPGVKVHHNLVTRTRQSGLRGSDVHHNEVYIDSWATNSFGIQLDESGTAYNNKIFGTGYHVVAFGWGHKQTFRNNFIHLEGTAVKGRFSEYGDQVSLNGFRLTQYHGATYERHDNLYHDNTVIIRGRESSQGRGAQFWGDPNVKRLIFRNNTVKAVTTDSQTTRIATIVPQGAYSRADEHEPITYEANHLISNICNVRFGDGYGVGSNTRFISCTFTRVGEDERYKTFIFGRAATSKGHVVRDPKFKGGASMDSIEFTAENQDITFEWTITINSAPNAMVEITDATGDVVFRGRAGDTGQLAVPLAQYNVTPTGKTMLTPHTITLTAAGKVRSSRITADEMKVVNLPLE